MSRGAEEAEPRRKRRGGPPRSYIRRAERDIVSRRGEAEEARGAAEEARVCGAEAQSSPFGGGGERRAAEEEAEWGLGFGS